VHIQEEKIGVFLNIHVLFCRSDILVDTHNSLFGRGTLDGRQDRGDIGGRFFFNGKKADPFASPEKI